MDAIYFILFLNSIYWASVLFLMSLGLNIILGVGKILNLTHGEFYAFGAYAATWIIITLRTSPLPLFLLFLLFGVLIAALMGFITEYIFIRPMYKRVLEYQLLITYGLLLLYEDIIRLIWGGEEYYASKPMDILGSLNIAGYVYPVYFLFVIIVAIITGLIVWHILFKTKIGIMLRAVAMDREMANALGLNVKKLSTYAFIFGTALAGLAGSLMAPSSAVVLGIGLDPLLLSFLVVIIGGLGSLQGALIGSLIIGFLRSIGIAFFPEIELAVTYLVAALLLIIRPQGLMGGK